MKAFVIGLSIMMAAAGSRGNAGSGTCAAGAGIYAAGFDAGRLAGFVPAGRDGVTQVGEPDWETNEETESHADGENTVPNETVEETAGNGNPETAPGSEAAENQAAETVYEENGADHETDQKEAGAEEQAEAVSGNGRWVSLGDD